MNVLSADRPLAEHLLFYTFSMMPQEKKNTRNYCNHKICSNDVSKLLVKTMYATKRTKWFLISLHLACAKTFELGIPLKN